MAKPSSLPPWVTHDDKSIKGFKGPYGFLSNFTTAKVEWLGVEYQSVEAAYQAAKSTDPALRLSFSFLTALEAKQKGNAIKLRPDWEDIKNNVMIYLVTQKFSRHPYLRQRLIETGDKYLEEANVWKDNHWGVVYKQDLTTLKWVPDPKGQNYLGRILSETRRLLV